MPVRPRCVGSRSAMRRPMQRCEGGLAMAAMHEVFAEGRQSAAATGFIAGLAGRVAPRRPLVWVRQDFSEIESGALSMSGLCRTRSRSASCRDRARRRCRYRVADHRRRAGLRCARRRRAGSLGRGAAVRSRRQPQADIGRAGLRRHRVCCCGWRRSRCLRPRRPDGSCARRIRRPRQSWSAWGAPVFDAQLVRNRHGPVGRWIMEWKCDECLFSEPAAYPQPVAAAPAHRPHQAQAQLRTAEQRQAARIIDAPSIVVAKQNNALQIYALDDAAARAGLEIGLPLANARAICPELQVFDADEVADAKTLNDIADWCDRFTPLVALDPPHGLFLDITGCAHLFGGEARMLQIAVRRADAAGLCRQRRDRRHLGLRAHADAACLWPNRRRWRGGRCRQAAAGVRARRG